MVFPSYKRNEAINISCQNHDIYYRRIARPFSPPAASSPHPTPSAPPPPHRPRSPQGLRHRTAPDHHSSISSPRLRAPQHPDVNSVSLLDVEDVKWGGVGEQLRSAGARGGRVWEGPVALVDATPTSSTVPLPSSPPHDERPTSSELTPSLIWARRPLDLRVQSIPTKDRSVHRLCWIIRNNFHD
jgi:hypothetical protein